jgi:hypothetical protein
MSSCRNLRKLDVDSGIVEGRRRTVRCLAYTTRSLIGSGSFIPSTVIRSCAPSRTNMNDIRSCHDWVSVVKRCGRDWRSVNANHGR